MMIHMKILNIFLFLIYTYGLGYSLTRSIKEKGLEVTVIRIGIGLGCVPLLGIILNLLHIPLDWRIFLLLSSFFPLIDLMAAIKSKSLKRPPKITKTTLILLGIFLVCVFIYCSGPFNYPWLENDDPWTQAAGIKYIALEKNINVPSGEFQYLNPYPPGYGLLFGILHQTHQSLYWTLKFFNGLIIAFGYLFFYFFAKEFTKNNKKALFATFFLAAIPCYLSHFIWAHTLAVTLFFPALYTLLKSEEDKRFILPACICCFRDSLNAANPKY